VREPGNIHHRVLDLFLDVYGFNLTYEMLEANESMRADPCLGHHCSFTGVCLAAADWSRYSCACLGDFYGDECQFSPRCGPDSAARSSSSLCNNGGTCRYYIGSKTQTCICPPEYKGSRCEYLVRPEQVLGEHDICHLQSLRLVQTCAHDINKSFSLFHVIALASIAITVPK
ncbi:hypothetical protein MRX96_053169, partial [Rhipicephalus microplus]